MSDKADAVDDLERFRLPPRSGEVRADAMLTQKVALKKARRRRGEFLKGPIPLGWLGRAAQLSGKAPLTVALAIWFQAGRRRSKQVRLTTPVLRRFGVNRKAKYSGLKSLEKAGLVGVHREPKKNPVVTILDLNDKTEPGSAAGKSPAADFGSA
jgi:hypothetical protein